MSIMSSRIVRHKIVVDELKKMGAKVYEIQGVQVLVKFRFEGVKITYSYHINEDNTYFLERVKPYVLSIGDFQEEEQILDVIREDIKQFQNAMRSSNFKSFIAIDHHLAQLVRVFEDLYLYYNLSKDDVDVLNSGVNTLLDTMKAIMNRSTRAYTDKEPEVLTQDMTFTDEA